MSEVSVSLRRIAALREQTARLRRRRPGTAEALGQDVDLDDALSMSLLVAIQCATRLGVVVATGPQ